MKVSLLKDGQLVYRLVDEYVLRNPAQFRLVEITTYREHHCDISISERCHHRLVKEHKGIEDCAQGCVDDRPFPASVELIVQTGVLVLRCSAVQRGADEFELLVRKRFIVELKRTRRVDVRKRRIVVDHLCDEIIRFDAPIPPHRKRHQFHDGRIPQQTGHM